MNKITIGIIVALLSAAGFQTWRISDLIDDRARLTQENNQLKSDAIEWEQKLSDANNRVSQLDKLLADREMVRINLAKDNEALEKRIEQLKKGDQNVEKWLDSDIPDSISQLLRESGSQAR